jgi:hypothetical protein
MSESDLLHVALSRRQVFVLGAGATGLLAAAYAGLRQVGVYETPTETYEILTPKEVAVLRKLGEFLLPSGSSLPGHGGDDETLHRIDSLLASLPKHKRTLVRALPQVFEHGTTLERFGARCMSKMPTERCEEYLTDWANDETTIRAQLWVAGKLLYGMSYFERPDVLASISCPIPCGGGA